MTFPTASLTCAVTVWSGETYAKSSVSPSCSRRLRADMSYGTGSHALSFGNAESRLTSIVCEVIRAPVLTPLGRGKIWVVGTVDASEAPELVHAFGPGLLRTASRR